jgi:hypothetical protein
LACADVIGDVTREIGLGKTEAAQFRRHSVRGMVAKKQKLGGRKPIMEFVRCLAHLQVL